MPLNESKRVRRRPGMGLIWGIMVVFVTVTLVLGVTQFRSFVTSSTESVANEVNALAAAEAGINWALAELQANASFQTHALARVTNADAVLKTPGTVPELKYESPQKMPSVLDGLGGKLPGGFEVEATAAGPWKGVVGKGQGGIGRGFAGEFQVVIAPVFLPGEATPRKVIESVGRFGKRQTGLRTIVELNGPVVIPPPTWPPPGGTPPGGGPPPTIEVPSPPKPLPPPPSPVKPVPVPTLFPPPIEVTPVGPPPGGWPPIYNPEPPPGGWILTFASSLANWLIADGEFVDVGMGSPSDPRNTNVFKYGGFYGQYGVQLGNIEPGTNGTEQQFRSFGYFQSAGTVWFKDSFPRTTFFDPNQPAQVSGEADLGPYPSRPVMPDPGLYFQTGGMVRYDKLPLPDLIQSMEATLRDPRVRNKIDIGSGSLLTGTPDDQPGYAGRPFLQEMPFDNPYGNPGPTIVLDFGKPKYLAGVAPGEGDDPINYAGAGLPDSDPDPSRVTAFLYCKGKNVVVMGCPDRDVIIYTDRDIYVAGDFNQSPWHHQTYTSQLDPAYADRDGRDTRYIDPVRFAIDGPAVAQGEPTNLEYLESCREGCSAWMPLRRDDPVNRGKWCYGTEERKLAFLVAGSRVWFDYRHPSRFLANELVPWIEYRLLKAMGAPDVEAARAVSYQSPAEFSVVARARTLNLSAPPPPFPPQAVDPFIANVLKLPPGPGADRARVLLTRPLVGDPAQGLVLLAEQLFYVLQVEDVAGHTTGASASGVFGMAQEYYDTVFDASSASPSLNRVRLPGADPVLTRMYVPEQTINAIIMDGAHRYGVWKMDPSSDAKIHDELGNSGARGNKYLRYADNPKASPVIGRVFGSVWHLRQYDPNPNLFEKGGVYLPHKRKRVYDRGQARFLDASLRMGTGGLGGMKNTFTLRAWNALDGVLPWAITVDVP